MIQQDENYLKNYLNNKISGWVLKYYCLDLLRINKNVIVSFGDLRIILRKIQPLWFVLVFLVWKKKKK